MPADKKPAAGSDLYRFKLRYLRKSIAPYDPNEYCIDRNIDNAFYNARRQQRNKAVAVHNVEPECVQQKVQENTELLQRPEEPVSL